jgi:hypothetical protein
MTEQSYDECIEIAIRALTWQAGPMFDASLFDGAYDGPEDNPDQIDRAEAPAMLAKGVLVTELGWKLSDMGVDDPCPVLEGLLKSDRVATGLKSTVHGVARRGDGFIVFLVGEDPAPGYQVLVRLLPSGDRLNAQPQPAKIEQPAPKSAPRRLQDEIEEVIATLAQAIEAQRVRSLTEATDYILGSEDGRAQRLKEKGLRDDWTPWRIKSQCWPAARKRAEHKPKLGRRPKD